MVRQQARHAIFGARGAALVAVIAALGLAACGPAVGSGAVTSAPPSAPTGSAAPAPVLTYYLDQTYTAVGQEESPKAGYLDALKMCQDAKLPTTPLSAADVAKLATERVRTWQRPGHRVVQRGTWRVAMLETVNPCAFNGIQEEIVREVRVLPQTLYVINLTKGTVHVQMQAGPPTSLSPPIPAAWLKKVAAAAAAKGLSKQVGDSHFLGQPCAVWKIYQADGSLWYTECRWTGGLANGISPVFMPLWRKPGTTAPQGRRVMTTTTFLVGHLPPGSDAVFKVPAHAGQMATAGAKP